MSPSALLSAEETRSEAVAVADESVRSGFSQYLTPYQTASLAASMFSDASEPLRCLDLGAGTGILSVALAERYGARVAVDCVELDGGMAAICDADLSRLGVEHEMVVADALGIEPRPVYDRVILNPPYKKMARDDFRQRALPVRSPNLYTAFMMIAARSLAQGGECVAIVPRSWTNGQYFHPFREWLMDRFSLDAIHVYGSRTEIFSDTNVLQETMLVRFSRRHQVSEITVSEAVDKSSEPVVTRYPFHALVDVDGDLTVRVEPEAAGPLEGLSTLKDQGLCASTGKVVDFRSRGVIHRDFVKGLNRLIYSANFSADGFKHPVDGAKPQWIDCASEKFARQLIPAGSYVVVKRFSSKEEARRVKAYPLDLDEPQALENHLNFIHCGSPRKTKALAADVARGLALWLSTTVVEKWFRARSGSTQVNASDLNATPTPDLHRLVEIGAGWHLHMSQEEIDELCLNS